ncbi:MAG: hypothetical protein ACD_73C00405G0005 [uncultured bacterium]|nr:MAG: hypothetical protein ACD_73C00405G0005 [uncultured bacterium]
MNRRPKDFLYAAFFAPPALILIFFLRFLAMYHGTHSFYDVWKITSHDELVLGFSLWVSWFCMVIYILLSPLTKKMANNYGPRFEKPDSKWINSISIVWYIMTFVGPFVGWIIAGYFTLSSLRVDNWHIRLWIRLILSGVLPLFLLIGPVAYAYRNRSWATLMLLPLFGIVPLVSTISPAYDIYFGPRNISARIEDVLWISNNTGLLYLENDRVFRFSEQARNKTKIFKKDDFFYGPVLDGMRLILPKADGTHY